MYATPEEFARSLAKAAREMHSRRDLLSTLQVIAETAQRSLPGIDHAGISVTHRDGRVETMAATDQLVWKLDQLQYELNEGPCLDAIWTDTVVRVDNAHHEQRWPRFIPGAVALGLRAQLGLRLYDAQTLGSLNLYATESDTINPDTVWMAELLATQAAIALGHARQEEHLNQALFTRKVIGQAIGILMGRYDLDEDRAFAFLTRVSQDGNTKLRDVAARLVETTNADNRLPAKTSRQEAAPARASDRGREARTAEGETAAV
jgi:GAF domain-containing protein